MSGKGKRFIPTNVSGNNNFIDTENVIHIDDRSSSIQPNVGKPGTGKDEFKTNPQIDLPENYGNLPNINLDLNMAQTDFNNRTIQALNFIASSVVHPTENGKQLFLEQRNIIRKLNGLKPVNYIYCAICNAINEHLTSNCPHAKCNICLNFGHTANNCNFNKICQFCNSRDHPTAGCKSDEAINIRAMRNKKCLVCGSWGHVANKCYLYNPKQMNNGNRNTNANIRRRNKRKIRRFKRIRRNK